MKVLVTGHNGYIGSVMVPMLQAAGHDVVGLDNYLFEACTLGNEVPDVPALRIDLRDVQASHLMGFDAVIHLAALSNDPLSNLNADSTYEINHRASVRLARLAREVGIPRFVYASSCSLYGLAGDELLKEDAAFNPITAYGISKVKVEEDVSKLADQNFSPTFMRNATAYGFSPRLRADVVVNNLVGFAHTTGEIFIQSDGTPWRPLVHIEDISRAFLVVLEADRDRIHNQAFNVGKTEENYRISQLADMVKEIIPSSKVRYAEGGGPDPRCYKVNCDKLATTFPEFKPEWNVRRGMLQLHLAFKQFGLTESEFLGDKYLRIKHIQKLQGEGRLDSDLRWKDGQGQGEASLHSASLASPRS